MQYFTRIDSASIHTGQRNSNASFSAPAYCSSRAICSRLNHAFAEELVANMSGHVVRTIEGKVIPIEHRKNICAWQSGWADCTGPRIIWVLLTQEIVHIQIGDPIGRRCEILLHGMHVTVQGPICIVKRICAIGSGRESRARPANLWKQVCIAKEKSGRPFASNEARKLFEKGALVV